MLWLCQFAILPCREVQPYSTASDLDAMLNRLAAFQVHCAAAALDNLEELPNVSEVQLLWKRRVQVFLKELATLAVPEHEAHINLPPGLAVGNATSAIPLAWRVRGWKGALTSAADFPTQSSAGCRGTLTTHCGRIGKTIAKVIHSLACGARVQIGWWA